MGGDVVQGDDRGDGAARAGDLPEEVEGTREGGRVEDDEGEIDAAPPRGIREGGGSAGERIDDDLLVGEFAMRE